MTDLRNWLKNKFGVDLPSESDLPSPLDDVVKKITTLEVTVRRFHVKIPGTNDKKENSQAGTLYTFELAGDWPDQGIPLIPDVLTIRGVVLGASNE